MPAGWQEEVYDLRDERQSVALLIAAAPENLPMVSEAARPSSPRAVSMLELSWLGPTWPKPVVVPVSISSFEKDYGDPGIPRVFAEPSLP